MLLPARLIEAVAAGEAWQWELGGGQDGHGHDQGFEISGGEGSGYIDLMNWYEHATRVSTVKLLEALVRGYGIQMWWGELRAFGQPQDSIPLLTIAAFDSTWYDIDGAAELVGTLASAFEDAIVSN